MTGSCKSKSCGNYRSIEKGLAPSYRNLHAVNCKDCVYFSSRNCGMDTAQSITVDFEMVG